MIWKILKIKQKRYEKYEENSEKVWKICRKSKLNSRKIWKIKRWQTFVRNVIIVINNVIMKIKWWGRGR
jgi:hypothetical protein